MRYFFFLVWAVTIAASALYLFTGGFLLRRQVLEDRTVVSEAERPPQLFNKSIVLIVDALKYEFALKTDEASPGEREGDSHYRNRLPIFDELSRSGHGRLFEFLADPPTTTMQRLKGMTTGSLPTFIDVSSNFGSYAITEDNIIDQLRESGGKRVVFAGDDTWMSLFPGRFDSAHPYPSFDVWDLDTVDRGVRKHLNEFLNQTEGVDNQKEWDVLIGHFLGVDHAGHKFGPRHPEMRRKLNEVNDVVTKVVASMPDDCVLFVMGDHGMTMTGDHGGDSRDEVSAALFVYSKRLQFPRPLTNETVTVYQVDLVPTFSLLLGVPIPFSNLGKIIKSVWGAAPTQGLSSGSLLRYVDANVDQVMNYLDVYRTRGGKVPEKAYFELREKLVTYERSHRGYMTQEGLDSSIRTGLSLIRDAKLMCQMVWVNFDLNLMAAGLWLLFIHTCLLAMAAAIPRNRLISVVINNRFVMSLWLSAIAGCGATSLLLSLNILRGGDKEIEMMVAVSASISVMVCGFALLLKLRGSLKDVLLSTTREITLSKFCAFLLVVLAAVLGGNSYVVEESRLLLFSAQTIFLVFIVNLRLPHLAAAQVCRRNVKSFVVVLLLVIGLLRASAVYFRCREEQVDSGSCPDSQSDFHLPIGNLRDGDADYKFYKNWRFGATMLSTLFVVSVPTAFLYSAGNLNGYAPPVVAANYLPGVVGVSMISYWAVQARNEFIKTLVPWQQNLLAKAAFLLSLLTALVVIVQPKLLYVADSSSREAAMARRAQPNVLGVQGYFQMLQSDWRRHFKNAGSTYGRSKKVVFGLGSGISAALTAVCLSAALLSMLVLGDGLCPAVAVAMLVAVAFVYLTTVRRLQLASVHDDLFNVPWSAVVGWWVLESLFFFVTGHQPTFSTLQWTAAFAGFSGADYGTGTLNNLVPVLLVGWNTFCARILFGLALPFLLLAPFTLWMWSPSIKAHFGMASEAGSRAKGVDAAGDSSSSNGGGGIIAPGSVTAAKLDSGELVLIERAEETRSQLYLLCCKYLAVHALRLFSVMVCAGWLRRHLMVWKIFAPRFIFEGIGFGVSAAAVLAGYAIVSRVVGVLERYRRTLERDE